MISIGLVDAFRKVWPNEVARPGYTWTPGAPPPNVGATEVHDRIDFVYYWGTGVRAIDAVTVGIDKTNTNTDIAITGYPSDHRAVLGTSSSRLGNARGQAAQGGQDGHPGPEAAHTRSASCRETQAARSCAP